MNILDELAAFAKKRVEADRAIVSIEQLKEKCADIKGREHIFYDRLKRDGLSFICEIKKASPSKGIISEDFPYLDIARQYEDAGTDCVSCLTEPSRFLGSDKIFKEIRTEIDTPMIRKDFTVDEYQIYQAKCMGADALLLICALLGRDKIEKYLAICDELKIDALVEAHNEAEIKDAVAAGARIIGVNNRNLKDFSVDISNARRLREVVPKSCIYVAESGVKDAEDIAAIAKSGADAVLVGEAFMRANDKAAMLKSFRDASRRI